jgi:hypothetical protein
MHSKHLHPRIFTAPYVHDLGGRQAALAAARATLELAIADLEDVLYDEQCAALLGGPTMSLADLSRKKNDLGWLECLLEGTRAAEVAVLDRDDLMLFQPHWLDPFDLRNCVTTRIYNEIVDELPQAHDNGPVYVDCFALTVAIRAEAADLWGTIRNALTEVERLGWISFGAHSDPSRS